MKVAVNELVDGANHVVQCSGNVFANELDSDSHSFVGTLRVVIGSIYTSESSDRFNIYC